MIISGDSYFITGKITQSSLDFIILMAVSVKGHMKRIRVKGACGGQAWWHGGCSGPSLETQQ